MTALRIVLAEDHEIMREGLRMVLSQERNIDVVGEAGDGVAAIRLARQLRPDVVVMDISMPVLNGLKAMETLTRSLPDTKILILTRHTEVSYVRRALQSGASGYILKQSASDELVRAIRRVVTGQIYLDPAITAQAIVNVAAISTGRSAGRELSTREEDVIRFVALGFLAKEIATRLDVSIKTVESHKANAMSKMGMKSRIDIVRYAMLQGWLQDA